MPACSCFAVTASTNINYVESSSCFWEFECTGSGYNNGSLFYTATCTGAVVLNYFSSGFAGAYRINGVAKGSWSIGSNGTFSFSVNAGDVVSILISSIGTIHNPNDFYGDLAFSAATPTPFTNRANSYTHCHSFSYSFCHTIPMYKVLPPKDLLLPRLLIK